MFPVCNRQQAGGEVSMNNKAMAEILMILLYSSLVLFS